MLGDTLPDSNITPSDNVTSILTKLNETSNPELEVNALLILANVINTKKNVLNEKPSYNYSKLLQLLTKEPLFIDIITKIDSTNGNSDLANALSSAMFSIETANGNKQEASIYYNSIISNNSNQVNSDVNFKIAEGNYLLLNKESAKAKEAFNKAKELDQESITAGNKGLAYDSKFYIELGLMRCANGLYETISKEDLVSAKKLVVSNQKGLLITQYKLLKNVNIIYLTNKLITKQYTDVINLATKLKDKYSDLLSKKDVASINNTLGYAYIGLEQYSKSIQTFKLNKGFLNKNIVDYDKNSSNADINNLFGNLINGIGLALLGQKRLSSGIKYLSSINIDKLSPEHIARKEKLIATLYLILENPIKALETTNNILTSSYIKELNAKQNLDPNETINYIETLAINLQAATQSNQKSYEADYKEVEILFKNMPSQVKEGTGALIAKFSFDLNYNLSPLNTAFSIEDKIKVFTTKELSQKELFQVIESYIFFVKESADVTKLNQLSDMLKDSSYNSIKSPIAILLKKLSTSNSQLEMLSISLAVSSHELRSRTNNRVDKRALKALNSEIQNKNNKSLYKNYSIRIYNLLISTIK